MYRSLTMHLIMRIYNNLLHLNLFHIHHIMLSDFNCLDFCLLQSHMLFFFNWDYNQGFSLFDDFSSQPFYCIVFSLIFLSSSSTSSIHLFLDFPLDLLPTGPQSTIFLGILCCSSFHSVCSNQT